MHLVFDLDGVLAKYDRSAYEGENPAYKKPGYYRDLQPDDRMVNVVSTLAKYYNRDAADTNSHVYIKSTSAFFDGYDMLNQYRDKKEWIERYCYGIDPDTDFILLPKSSNKYSPARLIAELMFLDTVPTENIARNMRALTYRDILIDDWNTNLKDWDSMGGLAIKYSNGINSPNATEPDTSFEGIHISPNMSSSDIAKLLSTFDLHRAAAR